MRSRNGFTLVELIGWGALVLVIIGVLTVVGVVVYGSFIRAVIRGGWTSPAHSALAGQATTWTYHVDVKHGSTGTFAPLSGRPINFEVAPGLAFISWTPSSARTDAAGDIVLAVTPSPDFRGEMNLLATDSISGANDPPVRVTVTGP